jgi:transposase
MNKRRKFSRDFKTKVVLEALKERLTVSEIAEKFEVHPNQISTWKKQFLENAGNAFGESSSKSDKNIEQENDRLYKKIGKLQVQVDFLKKALES